MKPIRIIAIIALYLSSIGFVVAQHHKPDIEKLKAEKVAFITSKINLTVEESQKFWPVYNEMENKLDARRKEMSETMKAMKEKGDNITDADYEKATDMFINNELEEAKIKKEYHEKFKKLLPIEKVAKLYRAEKEFHKHLLHELRKHHKSNDMRKKDEPQKRKQQR